jgi:polar amino acid transport system substrate-binding protein/glutamate/aspartate transport system substrate-binding protein
MRTTERALAILLLLSGLLLSGLLVSGLSFAAESAAQAGTLERVRDTGTFRIGFREDAAPFSFLNANGQAAGYMVELCNQVAARVENELSLPALTIEYVAVTAANRFDAVSEGRIDLLCGPTSVTLSRRVQVDFSLHTFVDGASVIFRADGPGGFAELAGHKVAVRGGTTTANALSNTIAELKIDVEIEAVDSHDTGLARLESGLVSAYFADRTILARLLSTSTKPELLRLSPQVFTYEPYALALPRGDSEFRLLVDDTLARLYRDGENLKLFSRSFGANAKPSDALNWVFQVNALPQ